ncbi:YybS family protein [Paenibacillus oenotherae]|uniref:YybS family protein n=1 Tax=Paenibacillus oenotherae TaxID=1435645 RepID=A0ABS7D706_9BACL|nr:DUF2232 domain-containing protein [Paenibacillus oenotherae]MBW7475651.1 YybS family protein [Paenibacillus oenotherae]
MKTDLKSVLWSGAALLLLLSIAVPLLNVLSLVVMMVPAVVLYVQLPRREFAIHMVAVYGIATLILGPSAIIVGLFFLVPSIVMGHLYKKTAAARKVLTVTILVLLGQLLLELMLFDLLLNFKLISEVRVFIQQAFDYMNQIMLNPWSAEMVAANVQWIIQSIPRTLITVAFLLAVITHAIARPLLRRSGISVPGLQPAREWMLPRIVVFYYLIVLVANLMTPSEGDSFMTVALLNLVPLMQLAFSIQAMGFFFFIAHERDWHHVVPIMLSVLVFMFPPLSLIGVLDAGFHIRRAFKKP